MLYLHVRLFRHITLKGLHGKRRKMATGGNADLPCLHTGGSLYMLIWDTCGEKEKNLTLCSVMWTQSRLDFMNCVTDITT